MMRNTPDRFFSLSPGMRDNRNSCTNRSLPGKVPAYLSAYRSRIYQYYVKAGTQSIAPESIAGLKPRSHQIKKVIRDHFPQDRSASILDLGCGHGAFIHFIREAGYVDVSGIDRSPQQVAAANRLGVKNVLEGDLVETLRSLPEQSKDVIITFDVLEHFTAFMTHEP
jgi:cyclopropane fatty-acyl-phospholipid synthase-like methyltransferase